MKQTLTQNIKLIVLCLIIASGVSYVYADWAAPLSSPPTCIAGNPGCDAPLNTSATQQSKLGALLLNTSTTNPATNGLQVWGNSIFNGGVQVPTGASAGKVLTSDASGNATWQNSIPSNVKADSTAGSKTWTAPAGVTHIRVKIWGGGGGGGNGYYTADYGGGGGGGGYSESVLSVVPGTTYNYTVGGGGAPGGGSNGGPTGGTQNCSNGTTIDMYQGCPGGNSTFSNGTVTMTANGGKGGIPSFNDTTTHASIGWGGQSYGGAASGGNVMNLQGGNSDIGLNKSEKGGSGRGGDSPMGGQGGFAMSYCGISPAQIGLGDAGTVPGGGGGGGCAYSGGGGGSGMVIIEY